MGDLRAVLSLLSQTLSYRMAACESVCFQAAVHEGHHWHFLTAKRTEYNQKET